MQSDKILSILFLSILTTLLFTVTSAAQTNADSVKVLVDWEKNFETAITKAQEQGNEVFIYFWTDWCAPCKQMDAIVFSDPKLGPAINQYVNLKVNAEKGEGITLREKYDVGGYPTFIFIDKNGKEIGKIVGTRSKDKYLSLIENKGAEK